MQNWKELFPKENIYYETDNGILYNADSLELLEKFPKNSVDTVILDPDYSMLLVATAKNFVISRYRARLEEFFYELKDLVVKILDLISPVIKPSSSVCIFSPYSTTLLIQDIFKDGGYSLKSKYIWLKKDYVSDDYPKNIPLPPPIHENIFCFTNEKLPSNYKVKSRILLSKFHKRFRYIEEKPARLIEKIIMLNSKENDIILDPLAGSGTTALACERRNRRWICIEKEKKFCDIIINRINNPHKEVLRYG